MLHIYDYHANYIQRSYIVVKITAHCILFLQKYYLKTKF